MRRALVAVFIYLVIASGLVVGYYTSNPYKGNSVAVFEATGVGLVWPVVVIEFLFERVGEYYGDVGG